MSKIKGMDKLQRQFDRLQELDYTNAVLEGGEVLKGVSVRNAPFRTGFLKRSHKLELMSIKNAVKIVVSAPYALPVEYGTHKMKAQPYLRPAIDTTQSIVTKIIGKAAQDIIEDSI